MPHIHTASGEHDQSASAYIIRTDFDEPRIMLHRHKKLGVYLQFGGHIEIQENPWDSIVHELFEEVGYDIGQLQVLQPRDRIQALTNCILHPMTFYQATHDISEIHTTTHFHTDLGYAFVTSEEPAHPIADGESADILLLTRDELVDLPASQTKESVREACLYALDVCLAKWEPISPTNFT